MRFAERAARAIAAFKGVTWSGGGDAFARGSSVRVFGDLDSQIRVRGASGPVWSNSAVMACAAWIMDTLPEAKPLVKQGLGEDDDETVRQSLFYRFAADPNPSYDWVDLLSSTGFALAVEGNAYWVIHRDEYFQPWAEWLPPGACKPCAPRGEEMYGPKWFEVRRRGQSVARYSPDEVVHFRVGVDPANPLCGMARLQSAMREVMTDSEAAVYTHALLANPALGTIITLEDSEIAMSDEEAQKLKLLIQEQLGGEGRHGIGVPSHPIKATNIGVPPDKMAVRETRMTPEERICAVMRIPPMVVGLGSGLSRSTFSNMAEAREAATEQCLGPLWRKISATLTHRFLPMLGADRANEYVAFDLSGVRALQDDQNELYTRADKAYRGGLLKRSEGRSLLGFESEATDDVYFTDLTAGMSDEAAMKSLFKDAAERRRVLEASGVPDSD